MPKLKRSEPREEAYFFETVQEAQTKLKELIEEKAPYVCLVYSTHPYSEGYWIEFKQPELGKTDTVLEEWAFME